MLCCSESGPTLLQATRKNKMVSLKEITCITSVIFSGAPNGNFRKISVQKII